MKNRDINTTLSLESYLGKFIKVKIDRPLASRHPEHGFVYCLNYGFIPDIVSGDGEEIDVYVVGEFEAVAVIKRKNDVEDKLVVCKEKGKYSNEQIAALVEFQERFFETEIQMLQN